MLRGRRMARKPQKISAAVQKLRKEARVARLATVDAKGRPHIVPVCFAYDGKLFYTAVDQKPKRVPPERLARLQNIRAVPSVALLIDEYDDDWTRLWYILIRGKARLIAQSAHEEHAWAIRKLKSEIPSVCPACSRMTRRSSASLRERISVWGKT